MPGLFGYLDPHGCWSDRSADAMANALRFDEDENVTIRRAPWGLVGLVARVRPRNGRIDDAPIHVATPRTVLTLGEILAVADDDRRGPDTEALFAEGVPMQTLRGATGSYAAAVLDGRTARLELVTDLFGTRPVYFTQQGGAFFFATQIKALLACGCVPARVDPVAVGQLLRLGFLCGDHTLIDAVWLMPPASVLRATSEGISLQRYRQLQFSGDMPTDRSRMIDEIAALLRRAVERTVGGVARVGVPVSGGLDSRTLLALTPKPSEIPSFTFGRAGCRDLRFGAAVARAVGSPHVALPVQPEIFNDVFEVGVWLSEGALGVNHFHILPHVPIFARYCDVVLNGIGGDVMLGGKYVREPWMSGTDAGQAAEAVWAWLAKSGTPHERIERTRGPLVPADVWNSVRESVLRDFASSWGDRPIEKAMSFLLENRTRRFIGAGTELLRWRVESLHPFFDADLLSALERVPPHWRRRQRLYVDVIRRVAPRGARVRWQHTGLPVSMPYVVSCSAMALHRAADVAAAKLGMKSPFPGREASNFSEWFRGPLRPFVDGTLLSPRSLDRGVFAPDGVRLVVREHMNRRADHAQLLAVLISTELFCRLFLDDLNGSLNRWCRLDARAAAAAAPSFGVPAAGVRVLPGSPTTEN